MQSAWPEGSADVQDVSPVQGDTRTVQWGSWLWSLGLRLGRRPREGGGPAGSPSPHGQMAGGMGCGGASASRTQVQSFTWESAEAASGLDYREVFLICTER